MSDGFKQLDEHQEKDAVLSFESANSFLLKTGDLTSIVGEILSQNFEDINEILAEKNRGQINPNIKDNLLGKEGLICEFLGLAAKGWQKGKIRIKIRLEFCPDEPEIEETPVSEQTENIEPKSPLDDLRRQLNLDNQK